MHQTDALCPHIVENLKIFLKKKVKVSRQRHINYIIYELLIIKLDKLLTHAAL